MTCERCSDIHIGQLKGLNKNPCTCNCHVNIPNKHKLMQQKPQKQGDWFCQTCKEYHGRNQVCAV